MGFFTKIKETFNKLVSSVTQPKKTTTAPKIAAPTQSQMKASLPSSFQQSGARQVATTSTSQTQPGKPIANVAQPASSTALGATPTNVNTPSGIGRSSNNLQTLTIRPGQNEQVAAKTFDPSVENAIRTGTRVALEVGATTVAGAGIGMLANAGKAADAATKLVAQNQMLQKTWNLAKSLNNLNLKSPMMKIGTNGLIETAKGTAGTIATNPATVIATKSWLMKLGFGGAAVTAILAALGSYPWAGHLKADNAIGTLTMAKRDAIMRNMPPEVYAEADALLEEILNPQGWETLKENIPYVNVLKEVSDIEKGTILADQIYDQMYEYQQMGLQEGSSEYWDKINADKATQEKAATDYYNQQRIITENQILAAREAKDKAKDARERKRRDDDIKAWTDYKANLLAMEEANRQAQLAYWREYNRLYIQMQEDRTPSNLKFGLL